MRFLDAGAYGIICPMISSAAEAAALVSACRYPPVGTRSFGPARGLTYGGADYAAHANDEILVLGMIETQGGLDDLDAIVKGLPPRRLQVAEPELASRYVRTTTLTTPRTGAVPT